MTLHIYDDVDICVKNAFSTKYKDFLLWNVVSKGVHAVQTTPLVFLAPVCSQDASISKMAVITVYLLWSICYCNSENVFNNKKVVCAGVSPNVY